MSEKKLTLSNSSVTMLTETLKVMRNYNFDSLNVPILIYGIVNCSDESDSYNPLESYFYGVNEVDALEIEDSLSMMITDYIIKLQTLYKEKHPMEETGKTKVKGISTETALSNMKKSSDLKSSKDEPSSEESTDDEKKEPTPLQPDFEKTLSFKTPDGKTFSFPANHDLVEIYEKLVELSKTFSLDEITPLHFTVACFMIENHELKHFFKELCQNYYDAKKYFKPDRALKLGIIPFVLTGFLNTLNDKIDAKKPCEILKRDEETEKLWNIMLKKNKRNAVIVGEAGVGKTALVEKITYEINKGTCPEEFKDFKVISLDVNSLIAGTSYRGDAEQRISDIISFLENNHDVILFIDEVHTILGAGSCFEGEMDLANALKPILARGETIVIGATTNEEYEKYFKRDAALSRRFEKVDVEEPLSEDVYPMIKNKIRVLSAFHNVKITKSVAEYAIMIASCFAFEKKNPDKSLDLIDRSMVAAKRDHKEYVDKDSILKNFNIFFKMWNTMSEESKKEIAYHEAGHYIVGKASGRLVQHNWIAVSIMPADNYLGVTVYEFDNNKVSFNNIDYFIDTIALALGGRVGEKLFRNDFTSGASVDLNSASKTAFEVVTKYGMGNDSIKNRIYINSENYPMFSEKSTDMINEEVDKLIEKAYGRATQLLNDNKDILEAIVAALLKNRIMSEKELDRVWKSVIKKRK